MNRDQRRAILRAMLDGIEAQVYQARVNVSMATGSGDLDVAKEQQALVVKLERGLAKVRREYAADLAPASAKRKG